jgi:hypothetical protein
LAVGVVAWFQLPKHGVQGVEEDALYLFAARWVALHQADKIVDVHVYVLQWCFIMLCGVVGWW